MKYNFRNAQAEDYGRVIKVIDSWFDRPVAHRIHEVNFIHFKDTSFILDDEEDELIAFLVGFWSQTYLDTSYIHFVGVRPDFRSNGIARELYEQFFRNSLDAGRNVVRCMTSPQNSGSIKFHRKLGFDLVESKYSENNAPVLRNYCGSSDSKVLFQGTLQPTHKSVGVEALLGQRVRLELLRLQHRNQIHAALADMPSYVWDHLPVALNSTESIDSWIEAHLEQCRAGLRIPYVIVTKHDGRLVGSTSFLSPDRKNKNIEIGWTWLDRNVWGSGINTECKMLLLQHAFTNLNCVRVQFKTDHNNARSRAALEKVGARYEGTLRRHMIMSTGKYRDSAFYSVTAEDWPKIKSRLEQAMVQNPSNQGHKTAQPTEALS